MKRSILLVGGVVGFFTLKIIEQRDVSFKILKLRYPNEFYSEQFGKTVQCSEWGAERFIVRRTNRAGEAG